MELSIAQIIAVLEDYAPPSLQENYDNAGLITGQKSWNCTGIICCLDATEAVVMEAKEAGCNLIIAHHPIVFGGLKRINGYNYVEQTVIAAIKHDIAIYAIHTNLDNILNGVNGCLAKQLGLINCNILQPKQQLLLKLITFVPVAYAEMVKSALFAAGAGQIGNYSETSFNSPGTGTFKANAQATPYVGVHDKRHEEAEIRIETIVPQWLQHQVVAALKTSHPYEEVAYDLVPLANKHEQVGSGLIGQLHQPMEEVTFLQMLKTAFNLKVVKHTPLLGKKVQKIALCGGAGSFLTKQALALKADFFITADMKYHEFFDADGKMVIADIGHYESEQFTQGLLADILQHNFPTFAILQTKVDTNPVQYFI
jgi:dinuclear metal center YbgI/SA1388 family protein